MTTRDTWTDADGRRLRVTVTVAQEADSFWYRRPPPLRVGEFAADELPPEAPGKP
jgi:hypothetical protein